jgi:hypothetical protein
MPRLNPTGTMRPCEARASHDPTAKIAAAVTKKSTNKNAANDLMSSNAQAKLAKATPAIAVTINA